MEYEAQPGLPETVKKPNQKTKLKKFRAVTENRHKSALWKYVESILVVGSVVAWAGVKALVPYGMEWQGVGSGMVSRAVIAANT